jgi:hypothetical protein
VKVAQEKRRAYRDCGIGKAGSGFAIHAPNCCCWAWRPGARLEPDRPDTTGDRSGDFLYKALHKAGFANQPAAAHSGDRSPADRVYYRGLPLRPPGNKPLL